MAFNVVESKYSHSLVGHAGGGHTSLLNGEKGLLSSLLLGIFMWG
jgi:hypothetical protein